MRTLMMTCLIAANRARIEASEVGSRVEKLLMEPNFILLIKKHMETAAGAPILASIPRALDAIIAQERRKDRAVADLEHAKSLLVAVVAQQDAADPG